MNHPKSRPFRTLGMWRDEKLRRLSMRRNILHFRAPDYADLGTRAPDSLRRQGLEEVGWPEWLLFLTH